jgi:hypothetical protein
MHNQIIKITNFYNNFILIYIKYFNIYYYLMPIAHIIFIIIGSVAFVFCCGYCIAKRYNI